MTPQVRSSLRCLRVHAVTQSFPQCASLENAIENLGFIQADPIRSPARAQDLILRQRVEAYRAGDLERHYGTLAIEEDYFYAYGFVHRSVWETLHPRETGGLSAFENKVLAQVAKLGETHPAALETHFGRTRVINDWGGYSKATTRALESLHYRGLLRVSRRENGIRVYSPSVKADTQPSSGRLRKLILLLVNILAPVSSQTLHRNIAGFRKLGNARNTVRDLIREGALQTRTADGIQYIHTPCPDLPDEAPRLVRFLAPFDPVVWDRSRFEHLWGWPYRFEAYTPPAKRIRGYYAMPLLWAENVIGWANAGINEGRLQIETGFVKSGPRDRQFQRALDAEIDRLRSFLGILH
jgi:uncharacterized protein YcaQ